MSLCLGVDGSLAIHGSVLKDVLWIPRRQRSLDIDQLGMDTAWLDPSFLFPLHIILPGELGESPVAGHNDFLPTRELELGAS